MSVGCAYDVDPEGSAAGLTITDECRIVGLGMLADGDFVAGRVTGFDSTTVTGSWVHIVPPTEGEEECDCPGRGRRVGHEEERGRGHTRGRGRGHDCDHEPEPTVVLLDPDAVLCRINGIAIGDFTGTAEVDGAPGFTYSVNVQDRGDPSVTPRTLDFYTLSVFDASGTRVVFREGDVVTGDIRVTQSSP